MKIRTDFVTNSSSSSYCVEIDITDKQNNVYSWTVDPERYVEYYGNADMKISWNTIKQAEDVAELCDLLAKTVIVQAENCEIKIFDYIKKDDNRMTDIGDIDEGFSLDGKAYVLTGFTSNQETELESFLEEQGAERKSAVSGKTDILIFNPHYKKITTKYQKAVELISSGTDIKCLSAVTIQGLFDTDHIWEMNEYLFDFYFDSYLRNLDFASDTKDAYNEFKQKLLGATDSIEDISKIRLVRRFNAFGEAAGAVLFNDRTIQRLAKEVSKTEGEEHESAVESMKTHLNTHVIENVDSYYSPWPSGFAGKVSAHYGWKGIAKDIEELADLIVKDEISYREEGFEWKELNLETGETSKGAEFTLLRDGMYGNISEPAESETDGGLSEFEKAQSDVEGAENEMVSLQSDMEKSESELENFQKILNQCEASRNDVISNFDAQIENLQMQLRNLENTAILTQNRIFEEELASVIAAVFGKNTKQKSSESADESYKRRLQEELSNLEIKKNQKIEELDKEIDDLRSKVAEAELWLSIDKMKLENAEPEIEPEKAADVSLEKETDELKNLTDDIDVQTEEKQDRISMQQSNADNENNIKMAETEEVKAEEKPKQETEEEMRARIEAEMRAEIEAEIRAKYGLETKEKAETAVSEESVKVKQKFNRPYVADEKLAASINRAFDKLEKYFPEGKVFAFNSIDDTLQERVSELYKKAGYSTVDEMLNAYGFEKISGDAVKELRNCVIYSPGNEPDIIKNKVDNALVLLNEYYPDHIIERGMYGEHKNLSKTISGLYQWLGYDDMKAFLAAYGYEYNVKEAGRPEARDYDELVNILVEKYKDGPKPKTMGDILFENPDLKGPLKTLQNKSKEVYGMTLTMYFEKLGIIDKHASSGSRKTRAVGTNDEVLDAIKDIYSKFDDNEAGTAEDAINCLEGMKVKKNKAGEIYIFSATEAGSKITIPYGINYISKAAFSGQKNLKEVEIDAELSEIPEKAFSECSELERIELPEGIEIIGPHAFAGCSALKSVVLPASLLRIDERAFAGCQALAEVKFKNPRTMVSDDAFNGCAYVYEAPYEEGATDSSFFKYTTDSKGNATISGFNGEMESVVIPGMIDGHPVTKIEKGAFQGCKSIVEVSMPDFITTIRGDVFRDCISLKKIHLSNGITKIISTAFSGCIGLKEINIPDGVTEIKNGTFKDCPIEKMHIGKGLGSISSKPFYSGKYDSRTGRLIATRSVNKITVDPANPYIKTEGSLVLSKDGKTLYAALGNKRQILIPEGVEVISDFAFEKLGLMTDVSFPKSLVTIGEKAFADTAIRSIRFGSHVRSIGAQAFASCSKLTAAVFNEGLERIGAEAFANSPIASVVLPSTVREIGEGSFDCLSKNYYIHSGNQEFKIAESSPYFKADGKALYTVSEEGLTLKMLYDAKYFHTYFTGNTIQTENEFTVEEGTKHIGPSAFRGCQNLVKVNMPEGLISIGESAFKDCSEIKSIEIPDSVETIGACAFEGSGIGRFELGASVSEIGHDAFITGNEWRYERTLLRGIKVDEDNSNYYVKHKILLKRKPDGTSAAVAYYGGGKTVVLPDGVSEICQSAFKRSNLEEIHIPSSVKVIGEDAFRGCKNLTRLRVGFEEPENGADFAVIYIPQIRNVYGEINDQYIDCIRMDGSGTVFDFVKYDSLFETIKNNHDKVLVATDRLKSAIQLVPLYRDQYLNFLRKKAELAVHIVVQYDDLAGLNTLAELGVFTGKNIDMVIEIANGAGKADVLSYLINFKNAELGITENDYEL